LIYVNIDRCGEGYEQTASPFSVEFPLPNPTELALGGSPLPEAGFRQMPLPEAGKRLVRLVGLGAFSLA
jgi:hypothetical protein